MTLSSDNWRWRDPETADAQTDSSVMFWDATVVDGKGAMIVTNR